MNPLEEHLMEHAGTEKPPIPSASGRRIRQADRLHVLKRVRDLGEWARFIHESISADQPYESGKRDLLLAYAGETLLTEMSRLSLGLAERLDQVVRLIESSAEPARRVGNSSH